MQKQMSQHDDEAQLEDVAAIMRDRGPVGKDEMPGTFAGSTGDIVLRLRDLGIYTHKARVAEVADLLFGDEATRTRPGAHRRITDSQFEIMCRAFVLCAAYGYTIEEIAMFLQNKTSREAIRSHLERGLALLDTIEEYRDLL